MNPTFPVIFDPSRPGFQRWRIVAAAGHQVTEALEKRLARGEHHAGEPVDFPAAVGNYPRAMNYHEQNHRRRCGNAVVNGNRDWYRFFIG
jgi:hypothetical protein